MCLHNAKTGNIFLNAWFNDKAKNLNKLKNTF